MSSTFNVDNVVSAMEAAAAGITDEENVVEEGAGTGEGDETKLSFAEEAVLNTTLILDLASPEEIGTICESATEQAAFTEMGIAMEKTVVRLDKNARFKHLLKAATIQEARKAKDPKFAKLMTLWKAERAIEAYFDRKYRSAAMKVAKERIKGYSSNGQKRPINNTMTNKEVGKAQVAGKLADRAVSQSKSMFHSVK